MRFYHNIVDEMIKYLSSKVEYIGVVYSIVSIEFVLIKQ